MLGKVRTFFLERGVLEIDCGALVSKAPLDPHIDCMSVDGTSAYLHTSPEYALKKLLARGAPDCYFLGHVYRKGEWGKRHNPEFTMIEWYRKGFSLFDLLQECSELLFLFLGVQKIRSLSYKAAFETFLGIDPFSIPLKSLQEKVGKSWDRTTSLQYLLSTHIEKELGNQEITALIEYPAEEAALAQVIEKEGARKALRFELYFQGIELANGYQELTDPKELLQRFQKTNIERVQEGKDAYPVDEDLLNCLSSLPDCSGVSVGFDRAFMLQRQESSLHHVIPYSYPDFI